MTAPTLDAKAPMNGAHVVDRITPTHIVTKGVTIISIFVSWTVPFFVLNEGFIDPFVETYPYFLGEIVLALGIFWVFGIYNLVSKYTGFSEILRIFAGILIIIVYKTIIAIIPSVPYCSFSWLVVSSMFLLAITILSRLYKRIYAYFVDSTRARENNGTRVMIVGAGDAKIEGTILTIGAQTSIVMR